MARKKLSMKREDLKEVVIAALIVYGVAALFIISVIIFN
tara:strand:+ start:1871 stop:1987 length:117 start_codon:yes stop_codon:yes gene_type:complete